jgi:structural maintenance of chromosomes protein 5
MLTKSIKNDAAQLNNLQQRQNAARPQIERIRRRNEIIAKIDTLKIKIPVAKYSVARQERINLKQQTQEALERAKKLEKANAPMMKRKEGYAARKNTIAAAAKGAQASLAALKKNIKQCDQKSQTFEEKASNLRLDLKQIKKAALSRKSKLDAMRAEVAKLERAVERTEEKWREIDEDELEQLNVYPYIASSNVGTHRASITKDFAIE